MIAPKSLKSNRELIKTEILKFWTQPIKITGSKKREGCRALVAIGKRMIVDKKIKIRNNLLFRRCIWLETKIRAMHVCEDSLNFPFRFRSNRKRNESATMQLSVYRANVAQRQWSKYLFFLRHNPEEIQ